MANELRIASGEKVSYQGSEYIITQVIDFKNVVAQKSGTRSFETLPISQLRPVETVQLKSNISTKSAMEAATDEEWNMALNKKSIIDPLMRGKRSGIEVVEAAKAAGVSRATIYNWITRLETTGLLSDLLNEEHDGGRGKGRLEPELEAVISATIKDFHLGACRP
ncbi:MAG: hypothetical protein A2076_12325 [Geobacteraceae bacterium GWC2_53_11]|nr:MAG: hypothetical protein A2076_12325 [Geobacteraceae bacterium GWC2_53_11]